MLFFFKSISGYLDAVVMSLLLFVVRFVCPLISIPKSINLFEC